MQQTTIKMFLKFLQEQNHTRGTVNSYVRLIGDLEEPPKTDNPRELLSFIDNALSLKKAALNRTSFASAQASLSSFFFMKTGIHIKEYRKQCIPKDMYDPLMEQYGSYCRDFLHLTEPVTLAAIREVKAFLKIIAPEPARADWSGFTADDVVAYLNAERSELCTASLGITVTAIRRFFRFLEHNDQPVHNSILNLPLSVTAWSKNSSLPIILSAEQQKKLEAYTFPETPIGLRDRLILCCFTELGLRCSEVANLQMEDILWHSGTIIIRSTKTRSQRELPVSATLGKALEEYVMHARPKSLGNKLFFKSERQMELPASTENIRSSIRRLYEKTGINGWHVGTHALRRTMGSRLYNAGNDLKTVADLLGHSSVSATKAYVRIDVDSLKEVTSSWPRRMNHE